MPARPPAPKRPERSPGVEAPPVPPLVGADADRLVAVLVEVESLASAAARCTRNPARSRGDLVVWLALLRDATTRLEVVLFDVGRVLGEIPDVVAGPSEDDPDIDWSEPAVATA